MLDFFTLQVFVGFIVLWPSYRIELQRCLPSLFCPVMLQIFVRAPASFFGALLYKDVAFLKLHMQPSYSFVSGSIPKLLIYCSLISASNFRNFKSAIVKFY
jgi:hypothetical protein